MLPKLGSTALFVLFLCVLVSGRFFGAALDSQKTVRENQILPELSNCQRQKDWVAPWKPKFNHPDQEQYASYKCESYVVHAALVQYKNQSQGREAISQSNELIPHNWRYGRTKEKLQGLDDFNATEYRLTANGHALRIWTWYSIGGYATSSAYTAKFMEFWSTLLLEDKPTNIFMIVVENEDNGNTLEIMQDRARTFWKWYQRQYHAA